MCAAAAVILLSGCSIDTVLTPPGDIGAVGSITPSLAAPMPPSPAPAAFPKPVPLQGQAEAGPYGAGPPGGTGTDDASFTPQLAPDSPAPAATPAASDERVVEGDTRDPVVAGVGTGEPRLVSGTGRGQISAPLLPETARQPDPPAASPGEAVAFNMRPADPAGLGGGMAPRSEPEQPSEAMPAAELACRRELRSLGVRYVDLPRISNGPACGIAYPIRLTGLSGGIKIKPAATLNCHVTAEFAKWVKRDVAPAARARYLSGIDSITQLSSYSCRTMNSEPGAPMSEHARGNAIDVGSITLNSGRKIDVRKPGWFAFRQRGFLNTVRADSCGYFNTVLGPGTNKYHWNHFHFDLRQRKSGRSYCE